MNPTSTKQQVHNELITRYKEYFESTLAIHLLHTPTLFPAVRKLSKSILTYLHKHKLAIIDMLDDPKIKHELYGKNFFGRLGEEVNSPQHSFNQIQEVLAHPKAKLEQIMQIHAVFIYRIYPKFNEKQKQLLVISDRARYEKNANPLLSTLLGITQNKVYSKLIRTKTDEHIRAVDRYQPNCQSCFFKTTVNHQLPFVAGPSGHTQSLLSGAVQLGLTSQEERTQYALACFSFLAAGGNHSFHEVMSVAKVFGVRYEVGNYQNSLPTTIMQSQLYQKLQKQFPDLLDDDEVSVSIEEMVNSAFGRACKKH